VQNLETALKQNSVNPKRRSMVTAQQAKAHYSRGIW